MSQENLRILCLETSARLGSAAISDSTQVIASKEFTGDQCHTSELMPAVRDLCANAGCKPSDIDEIYVSAGPGSFTGLRVGITAAKTIAFSCQARIVPVPSTDVAVLNAESLKVENLCDIKNVAVVMDAKKGQIYTSIFEKSCDNTNLVPGFHTLVEPSVMTPEELLKKSPKPLVLLGDGLRWHGKGLQEARVFVLDESYWHPSAENVFRCGLRRARAGLYMDPDQLTPIYLRRPEAEVKWEKLHGTGQ